MIRGMINLADSIGCKRPIYINILHSLRGQEHDIYYGLSFYVPDLITKKTVLGSGVYLSRWAVGVASDWTSSQHHMTHWLDMIGVNSNFSDLEGHLNSYDRMC